MRDLQKFAPLVASLLFAALGAVLLLPRVRAAFAEFGPPLAASVFLIAYGTFTNWLRLHAHTQNGLFRFLEKVRRAIAYEAPQ